MSGEGQRPLWAEVPLVLVHVAVVAGFARLYDDGSYLLPLLGFVLGAHVLAIACRRLNAPTGLTAAVAVAGGALAVTWILFPATARFGLPTTATWHAAAAALRQAREQYPVVVAPTAVLVGFQLIAGAALWAAVWFSDWTANRMRATGEPVIIAVAAFTFCSILGSGRHAVALSAGLAAALLLFVAVQRATAAGSAGPALLRGAAAVGAVAVLAGALLGPQLPGAGSPGTLHWRNHPGGDRSRVTVSPMVELRKRLVNQSDTLLFEVRASQRAYWRLTSLDRFDGEIWSSSGDYRPADETLPSDEPPDRAAATITQRVRIDALSAIWVPAAYEAVSVRASDQPLRWDPDSSTLIVDASQQTSDGLSYQLVSQAPSFTASVLDRSDGPDPAAITDRYLGLPADFPRQARRLADEATRGATSRYQAALALQDWFRQEFTYSLSSPPGHGDSALVDFLDSREGYCEQFAGAYAAMARALGIPARVAVGFTPGNPDPEDPTLYRVLGRHAHAWPEVYFAGLGWVPFEPTPGRGMPDAEAWTKVREQQDQNQPIVITTTAPPSATTTSADLPARPQATAPTRVDSEGPTGAAASADGPDRSRWPVLAVVAGGSVLALLVLAARRRRDRRSLASADPLERAWRRAATVAARRAGTVPDAAETPVELATRLGGDLGSAAAADLAELAELVTTARWAPEGIGDAERRRVDELVARLEEPAEAGAPAG